MACVQDRCRVTEMSHGSLSGEDIHIVKDICVEKRAGNEKEEIICVREVQLKNQASRTQINKV